MKKYVTACIILSRNIIIDFLPFAIISVAVRVHEMQGMSMVVSHAWLLICTIVKMPFVSGNKPAPGFSLLTLFSGSEKMIGFLNLTLFRAKLTLQNLLGTLPRGKFG